MKILFTKTLLMITLLSTASVTCFGQITKEFNTAIIVVDGTVETITVGKHYMVFDDNNLTLSILSKEIGDFTLDIAPHTLVLHKGYITYVALDRNGYIVKVLHYGESKELHLYIMGSRDRERVVLKFTAWD